MPIGTSACPNTAITLRPYFVQNTYVPHTNSSYPSQDQQQPPKEGRAPQFEKLCFRPMVSVHVRSKQQFTVSPVWLLQCNYNKIHTSAPKMKAIYFSSGDINPIITSTFELFSKVCYNADSLQCNYVGHTLFNNGLNCNCHQVQIHLCAPEWGIN
jgi:hypothetical protein